MDMHLVLLSGGSGKRLWPMSNDSRSKQFLRVLPGSNGQPISMVQQVWGQLGRVMKDSTVYVCASKAQVEMINAHLGDVPMIVEPSRRDTFAAIALSCLYLADVEGLPDTAVIGVMPVDQYVDDSYFEAVLKLERIIGDSEADLALLGAEPSEPSSKYGYIRLRSDCSSDGDYFKVSSFEEKPSYERAAELIGEGALWNCGVFGFRLGYVKAALRRGGYPESFTELLERYDLMPARSFDYEVVENTKSIVVLPYHGMWRDLGTWEALTKEMASHFIGKGISISCDNTHVINEFGIPLVTVGLQDTLVAATPDGILVLNKTMSSVVKDVVGDFAGRPMYEERKWGSYRVLDYTKLADGTEVLTRSIELLPGRNISYQKHMHRTEVWTIVEGYGELAIDTNIVSLAPGDVVRVFPNQWHAIRAIERLVFLEVQRGSPLVEEDIVRRFDHWEGIVSHCQALTL